MKNTTAFVICLLVIGCFAHPLKPAMGLKQTLFTEIATDDFGSNVLNLLSIHAVMGDPMEDLNNSLADIRAHVEAEEEWDSNTWDIERTELEQTIETNQNCFDEAVANVENFQTQLTNANTRLDNLNQQIEEYMTEREALRNRMTKHQGMVATETEAFETRQSDDEQAVDACNEAIRLLRGFPSAGTTSLIQVSELKDVTMKISTRAMKEGSAFLPLISALTSLVEMETVNPSACAEVITLLENLRDAIAAAKAQDIVSHNTNVAMWTQTFTDMTKQMDTLNTNIEDQEGKRTLTVTVIETTTKVLALEEKTRDNCNALLKAASATLETKTNDFGLRHRVRMGQLEVLTRLEEYVAQNLQVAYDEMNAMLL